MKKTSSTSWVWAALPWPGGTNITLSVKCSAGITLASALPEAPRADEAVLGAAVALDARVGEGVPVAPCDR